MRDWLSAVYESQDLFSEEQVREIYSRYMRKELRRRWWFDDESTEEYRVPFRGYILSAEKIIGRACDSMHLYGDLSALTDGQPVQIEPDCAQYIWSLAVPVLEKRMTKVWAVTLMQYPKGLSVVGLSRSRDGAARILREKSECLFMLVRLDFPDAVMSDGRIYKEKSCLADYVFMTDECLVEGLDLSKGAYGVCFRAPGTLNFIEAVSNRKASVRKYESDYSYHVSRRLRIYA